MKIRIKLFARCHELVGTRESELETYSGITTTELKKQIENHFPKLRSYMGSLLIAVNGEFADNNQVLEEGDEVALLPPLSGG